MKVVFLLFYLRSTYAFLGACTYSQERIWLDETIRNYLTETEKDLHNYNSLIVYQVTDGYLFIKRFRQALKNVLRKHEIFRTSYSYDSDGHSVQQKINSFKENDEYWFELSSFNPLKLDEILLDEQRTKSLDLNQGKLFRCRLLKQNETEVNRLMKDDCILFVFHHSAIDEFSKYLFFKDLTFAYQNDKLISDENQLRMIDYGSYERQLDLSKSQSFWEDYFSDYNFQEKLNLPYDDRKFNGISSGSFYFFEIDPSLTRQIFRYKKKSNLNLFRLFLSTYFCYLFKLTQQIDLPITGVTPNRYRKELNQLIGPLENFVIYRLILDPNKSFSHLNTQVEQICVDVKENAAYPYQQLITYARKFSSIQYPFNQVALRLFIDDDQWSLDVEKNLLLKKFNLYDHRLFPRKDKLTPLELTLNIVCNLDKQTIQFYFDYSNRLFDEEKIELLAKRYQKILKHLFDVSSNFDLDDEPICKLSIILPHEEMLINNINPRTMNN